MVVEVQVDELDAPAVPNARLQDVAIEGARYTAQLTTTNFEPDIDGALHVHLYWNSTPVLEAGEPGPGEWLMWDEPGRVDDAFFDLAGRPPDANAMCTVVADAGHSVADVDGDGTADHDTGNCMNLPMP
jgi:hypothetical protein